MIYFNLNDSGVIQYRGTVYTVQEFAVEQRYQ